MELLHDWLGDDDGLCESNDDCLYTPGFGSYQSDGEQDELSGSAIGSGGRLEDNPFANTAINRPLER